jgi:dTDP-4-amino-4,6-dideoxygalactose transaminase
LQQPYRACQQYRITRADRLLANTLTLPCSVNLTPEQLEQVVTVLQRKA